MRKSIFWIIIAISLMPGGIAAKQKIPIQVGVISFPSSDSKKQPTPLVRIGFVKNKKWEVMDLKSLPSKASWNIAFDGKNLGSLESRINESSLNLNQRSHLVATSFQKIRTFNNSKKKFRTWIGYDRFRPMVLVSGKNTNDPEKWKPAKENVAILKAKKKFSKNLNPIPICDEKTYKVKGNTKVEPNQILSIKSYKNELGEFIVGLQLPDYWTLTKCDGIAPNEFQAHWYYINNKTTQLIGKQIVPIDAGDYDNDGRSEWIFQISKYNKDGYGMFPLTTKKLIKFTWSYH